jgi:hypothetical protein
MILKQFILRTIFLVFITSLLCVAIFRIFFPNNFLLLYVFLPAIFGFINIIIFNSLLKAKDLSLLKFSNRYLLFTTLKLLGSIIFIVVFLFFNKGYAVPFLSSFLAIYLIFLMQEIIGILKFFNKKEKSETTHTKT